MTQLLFFTMSFLLLSGDYAFGYIPSSRMILSRVSENALKTPLYVDQDVTLTAADITISLKEQWLIESPNSIRLVVRGDKDLKDQFGFQVLYSEGQKTSSITGMLQSFKAPKSLLEKLLFVSKTEELMHSLAQLNIVPTEIQSSQNFKKLPGNSGFQYQPEPFLRLGRMGGVVAYVFGPPPKSEVTKPGLWVEQDQFYIMKIRTTQGEEIRFEKPTIFFRGARWPKEINCTWESAHGSPQAQITAHTVRPAEATHRQYFQKNADKRTPAFERSPGKSLIEEFYQRFR